MKIKSGGFIGIIGLEIRNDTVSINSDSDIVGFGVATVFSVENKRSYGKE